MNFSDIPLLLTQNEKTILSHLDTVEWKAMHEIEELKTIKPQSQSNALYRLTKRGMVEKRYVELKGSGYNQWRKFA